MGSITVQRLAGPLDVAVRLPGSKSLTNRALIIAALAGGTSRLRHVLLADDTRLMIDALRALGIDIAVDEASPTATVRGCGGHLPATNADLHCGNSGTTIRFCAALCALGYGEYRLDGSARMRQRPIGPLVDALSRLGAQVRYSAADGFPPVEIRARGLQGGEVLIRHPESSQFVSALLMAAPVARRDLLIVVQGPLISRPYVDMTAAVMKHFGGEIIAQAGEAESRFVVPAPQTYASADYAIEPDASNASYFLAAAALTGGRIVVEGLGMDSVQGDIGFAEVLTQMGCGVERSSKQTAVTGPVSGQRLRGVDVDLGAMPDTAQTLAVLALFAEGPTRIRNVANLRIKETDRLGALAFELRRFGAEVREHDDGLTINPPSRPQPIAVNTYDDHRMAMSFALAGLVLDGVTINDPECVNKTFPDFFDRWSALTASTA